MNITIYLLSVNIRAVVIGDMRVASGLCGSIASTLDTLFFNGQGGTVDGYAENTCCCHFRTCVRKVKNKCLQLET